MTVKSAPNPITEKLHKALALQKSGKYEKAQRLYKQVLKKHPDHADSHHLLGVTYRQLGFPWKAIKQIEKAIKIANDRAPYYSNLARAMSDIPNADNNSIVALTRKALDLDPTLIDAWNLHAISLHKIDCPEEAELIFQRLIKNYPEHVDAFRNYGVMLREKKDHEKAILFLTKSILMEPDNAEPYVLLAKSRQDRNELTIAYDFVKEALQRFPGNDALEHEYARICFKQGNAIEGLDSAVFAASAKSNNPDRQVTLGVCLLSHARYEEAISAFKRGIDLVGGSLATAEWNLSLAYLGTGDLKNGWSLYHNRLLADDLPVIKRKFNKPVWSGESLESKTILVYADQGVGDALRASTILPEVIAEAGQVIIETSEKLIAPFKCSFPEAIVRLATFETGSMEPTVDDYDFQTALSDLQCHYRPTIESFANARFPSLHADPHRVRELYARIPDADNKPIVGISWRSRNLAPSRVRNYFSVIDFSPIIEMDGIIFLNLQYLCVAKEIRYLSDRCKSSDFVHFDDVDQLDNLMDAGALARCCDLIITAPTSVIDIAGCHNIPCWGFGDPQAHFTLGQEFPPWYPSVHYTSISPDQTVADYVPQIVDWLQDWKSGFSPKIRLERIGS